MIVLDLVTPQKSLNPAYRKEKISREQIESFKHSLTLLFEKADPSLSEETLKSLIGHLLRQHGYEPHRHISVNKDRQDMSIHLGRTTADPVGVIIETKRPGAGDMISATKPNTKALHELVLYYLRERVSADNHELKFLVATDVFNWFIFDANDFDKKIYRNAAIRKLFDIYQQDGKDNEFFYNGLKEYFNQSADHLPATTFNLLSFKKVATNTLKADDLALIPVFKILSPHHLLKQSFANDSNTLDKGFYAELLHLIGLEEVKDGGKKIIRRKPAEQRNEASLLENALLKLQDKEALRNLDQSEKSGETAEEQYFHLALELCITWVNRILFMKLLEAQLLSYHEKDQKFLFLQTRLVHDFDELNNLFFQVLAEKPATRRAVLQAKFADVPYLNSNLFERTELERKTIDISSLDNQLTLPLLGGTVLKDGKGRRLAGSLNTLEYLFRFLDAYDFTSEGKAEIQEENKTLINASVLGLIFEKINGYKDGSFFTPGFITMYMCSETIRRAVVQKFNETKGWQCRNLDDLYEKIDDRQEANTIINSVTICDPAVGSGHFLVSALNELIGIKYYLKILQDRAGRRLKEYHLLIENDELVITDEDGEPFTYRPGNPESQRIQEMLFHEKQTLIENCLFGVDINPNSVKICRLRLWIELLKNAYYSREGIGPGEAPALETLPNIDINIKCGNSMISRFPLDADLSGALRKSKYNIDSYKIAVRNYKRAESKQEKRQLEDLIDSIRSDFQTEVETYNPINKKLNKLRGELFKLTQSNALFGEETAGKKKDLKRLENLASEISQLEAEKSSIQNNRIYLDAFEWRFEFPEVLDENGNFKGFDAVIGNPPYIRQEEISWMKDYLKKNYVTYSGTADLYVFFVEKGMELLKPKGNFCYILPNKWMKGGYGKPLREWARQWTTELMVDFGDLPVFEEATTYPSIWLMSKKSNGQRGFRAAIADTLQYPGGIESYLADRWLEVSGESLTSDSWNLVDTRLQALLDKLKSAGKPLGEYLDGKIYYGIKTGFNEAFVIDSDTRDRLMAEDPRSAELIKPFLAGRDIKRYTQPVNDKWLIFIPNGFTRKQFTFATPEDTFSAFSSAYPAIARFMLPFETKARARWDKGEFWWELRPCDYYNEFEKPKILYQEIAAYSTFVYDSNGLFTNNKLFLIPTDDLSLLGFLNSSLVWFYLKKTANILRGALALQSPYILSLPLPNMILGNAQLVDLVTQRMNCDASEVRFLEEAINQFIYQVFNLNNEDISLIEVGL